MVVESGNIIFFLASTNLVLDQKSKKEWHKKLIEYTGNSPVQKVPDMRLPKKALLLELRVVK